MGRHVIAARALQQLPSVTVTCADVILSDTSKHGLSSLVSLLLFITVIFYFGAVTCPGDCRYFLPQRPINLESLSLSRYFLPALSKLYCCRTRGQVHTTRVQPAYCSACCSARRFPLKKVTSVCQRFHSNSLMNFS